MTRADDGIAQGTGSSRVDPGWCSGTQGQQPVHERRRRNKLKSSRLMIRRRTFETNLFVNNRGPGPWQHSRAAQYRFSLLCVAFVVIGQPGAREATRLGLTSMRILTARALS